MFSEHILFSLALAITVYAIVKHKYSYALPMWVITFCAWLPDSDYIPFHICNFLTGGKWVPIRHGDFHNIFAIIALSLLVAYMLKKTLNYDFKVGFFCAFIASILHMICDVLVYNGNYYPLAIKNIKFVGLNLIPEHRSLLGVAEPAILFWGCVAVLLSLIVYIYIDKIPRTNQVNLIGDIQ